MTYELIWSIREDSPQGQNIAALAEIAHISREEAALQLLESGDQLPPRPANAAARRILGAFRQNAQLMDEVLDLAMADRERRNVTPLHARGCALA